MEQPIALVKELVKKHGNGPDSLIPILQGIIEKDRFLSEDAMSLVAQELDISTAKVFGTATFYSFLDIEPRGQFVIRLCRTITCDMKGKRDILDTIRDMLKIDLGETLTLRLLL
ncbi:MAG: hypothetical protein HC896_16640 [Bacteroidales bacterium]|nr:hypothetical protein [Bacteroidales bacterium]